VVVAALQWTEVIKLLVGDRERVNRGTAIFDLWTNDHQRSDDVPRRADCVCCGQRRFEYLDARATSRTASLCGRNAVQISPAHPLHLDLVELAKRLAPAGTVSVNEYLARFTVGEFELTVFPEGRAIVKGTGDPAVARSLYARYVGG
jgi:adenylyltransferase/sulfurtransferase